eukprot:m.184273 g.184273  ORF g.184273 m.184273 type:complete len:491 (+) comp15557_c1_seq4:73-1545(+)
MSEEDSDGVPGLVTRAEAARVTPVKGPPNTPPPLRRKSPESRPTSARSSYVTAANTPAVKSWSREQLRHPEMTSDASMASMLQAQEDLLGARELQGLSSPGTKTEATADETLAAALQQQESILASIPVKDAWKGDRGGPLEHNDSVLDFREPQQGSERRSIFRSSSTIPSTPERPTYTPSSAPTPLLRPEHATEDRSILCARQGLAHARKNELKDARKCFERGLTFEDGAEKVKMKIHGELSTVCRLLEDQEGALDHANQQYELAKKLSNQKHEMAALRSLGVASLLAGMKLGHVDDSESVEKSAKMLGKGLESFQKLAKLCEELEDFLGAAHAWKDVLRMHKALRNEVLAFEAAEKHLKFIRGRGSKLEIGKAVGEVAVMKAHLGETGDLEWDKKAFESVIELLWEQAAVGEELQQQLMIAQAYYHISRLCENAGSWLQYYGPAKARQYIQKSIDAYRAAGRLSPKHKAELNDAMQRLEVLNDDSCVVM